MIYITQSIRLNLKYRPSPSNAYGRRGSERERVARITCCIAPRSRKDAAAVLIRRLRAQEVMRAYSANACRGRLIEERLSFLPRFFVLIRQVLSQARHCLRRLPNR